jgi:hypothetical protein
VRQFGSGDGEAIRQSAETIHARGDYARCPPTQENDIHTESSPTPHHDIGEIERMIGIDFLPDANGSTQIEVENRQARYFGQGNEACVRVQEFARAHGLAWPQCF